MSWLDDLKPGDKVMIRIDRGRDDTVAVAEIAKVTKTQIVTATNERYRRYDGKLVGHKNARRLAPQIIRWDETLLTARREQARRERAWNAIEDLASRSKRPQHVSTDRLEAIAAELRGES